MPPLIASDDLPDGCVTHPVLGGKGAMGMPARGVGVADRDHVGFGELGLVVIVAARQAGVVALHLHVVGSAKREVIGVATGADLAGMEDVASSRDFPIGKLKGNAMRLAVSAACHWHLPVAVRVLTALPKPTTLDACYGNA